VEEKVRDLEGIFFFLFVVGRVSNFREVHFVNLYSVLDIFIIFFERLY
jgi:hypothetical protein